MADEYEKSAQTIIFCRDEQKSSGGHRSDGYELTNPLGKAKQSNIANHALPEFNAPSHWVDGKFPNHS